MVSSGALKTPHTPHLLNRYSIQQTLGARLGRRTLLGYDHERNSQVIIKYLCFEDPIEAADIRRFHQEVAVLKTLDHPAIPAYCDSFEIDQQRYRGLMLVQDYIEGKSLYALINSARVFTEEDIRNLADQILNILDYLHQQHPQIIHRDIKPSSLVLSHPFGPIGSKSGQVYLVDFGLVQSIENSSALADTPILISGTPGYRPPEQLGDRAAPATDLYSLGATLIHLATGQHPNTLPQRGLRILFSQELGSMSRPLKSWLRWLTQPKQHKRPVSAQAALQGLDQADEIFAPSRQRGLASLSQRFHRTLLETMAPANTQLRILEYSQTIEVLIPPLGWKSRRFLLATLQTAVSAAGIGLAVRGMPLLWPQIPGVWVRLLTMMVSLGWVYLNLRCSYKSLKNILSSLFQQVSIQLLPEIILLGHRFPCRPVNYHINTYKHHIEDIDLQPNSSVITVCLRHNRTLAGKLNHALSAKTLGLTQAEISWIYDILQLWLKQKVVNRSV